MQRYLKAVVLAVLVVLGGTYVSAQPFPSQITIAINQLVTGVTPFTSLRNVASAYLNWGTTAGVNGYGFRDNAGVIEAKNSGGSWLPLPTSSTLPTAASFITRVAEANLSNETALGGLATGILINTTTTGVPTIYAGSTCTNQVVTGISGIGAATCSNVNLSTLLLSGSLGVGNGGTGLTSGTSGGILAFTASGTLASSGALTASRIVLGGGAGAVPTVLGSLGTTTTVLHGNAAGAPTFGAVSLTADVSGILPVANGGTGMAFFTPAGPTVARTYTFPDANATILTSNAAVTAAQGGTGQTSYAIGDLIQATGATALSKLAAVSTGNVLISGGVATASSWGKIGLTTHVSGTLPVTNGGSGFASYSTGDVLYANSTTSLAKLADVAVGSVLVSGGVGTAPAYSANPRVSTLLLGANLSLSSAAPTISSGFGTSPSVTAGTAASFRVNVGTGGSATGGIVGLPTATTGWNCAVQNQTGVAANRADQRTVQTASSTTTATIQNQTISTGAALAFTASDVLAVTCIAY